MKAVIAGFRGLLKAVCRDHMLLAACSAPIMAGVAFRFGVPALEIVLTRWLGTSAVLAPWYGLFDLMLCMLTPVMFCFAAAMVVLEEVDSHVAAVLLVTPLGRRGYLTSRLLLPTAFGMAATLVLYPLFRLLALPVWLGLLLAAGGAAQGLIIAMMVVSFSTNKLEGMAIAKLSSLLMLGAFAPYVLGQNKVQYLLVGLPSFALAKALQGQNPLWGMVSLAVCAVWCAGLAKRFAAKTVY